MSFTFTSSGAIVRKAGKNCNADIATSGAALAEFCDQAEALIQATTRIDYLSTYSTLSANKKQILNQVTSDIAGMYIINWDMSGYTSRLEAQTMLDILNNSSQRGLKLLEEDKTKNFVNT
jgi:hypothetical protein